MTQYIIWSYRKRQWWGPDHAGYTSDMTRAGRYNRVEAAEIVFNGLPGSNVAVDEALVRHFQSEWTADEIEEQLDAWKRL